MRHGEQTVEQVIGKLLENTLQRNENIIPYVLDNTPPLFPHYFVPKVGRGLILEYAVNLDYTPPQPFLLHTAQVQTPQKVMVMFT